MAMKAVASSWARVRPRSSSGTICSSPPRRRTCTRSAVSNVLPPALAGERLAGVRRHQLVEAGALAVLLAQDAPPPLHVLAHRSAPRDHDGHVGVGDVHPLVEHP